MARLIAIDPGTRLAGFCAFFGGEAYTVGVVGSDENTLEGRAVAIGSGIAAACAGFDCCAVIVERPVVYPGSRERDSDIVDLAVSAGILGGHVARELQTSELVMPTPRQWKGTVPKHIHNARTADRCPAAVSLVGELPKSQRNHVWDAVGLALWYMERTK